MSQSSKHKCSCPPPIQAPPSFLKQNQFKMAARVERIERSERVERSERSDRTERVERTERVVKKNNEGLCALYTFKEKFGYFLTSGKPTKENVAEYNIYYPAYDLAQALLKENRINSNNAHSYYKKADGEVVNNIALKGYIIHEVSKLIIKLSDDKDQTFMRFRGSNPHDYDAADAFASDVVNAAMLQFAFRTRLLEKGRGGTADREGDAGREDDADREDHGDHGHRE